MSTSTHEITGSVPDPDLEPGQVVGEYTVEAKIGEGAFGTVFKAVHPLIGKLVAIKVLARKFSVDPEMVSRFIAEARAVNQIHNRHIIDIFSFGTVADGRHYYVMEFLDGEPLDATIARRGWLPLAEALPILRSIAKALDAAHAKGIAHRDLKPENVFLASEPDGGVYPKLLDFGIAKLLAPEDGLKHKTRTGAPIGTPYYMSPEQCRGKDVDHRTDFYAFGAVAYRMITGAYPFDGDDFVDILVKQIDAEPPLPSSLVDGLSEGVDDAVLWLMRKDPAERPPDLRTAMAALEVAAAEQGIVLQSSSSWDVPTGPSALKTRPPRAAGAAPTPTALPSVARTRSRPAAAGAMPATTLVDAATGLAATLAPPEPARRRSPVVIAISAAVVIAAVIVAYIVMHGGGSSGGGDDRTVVAPAGSGSPTSTPAPTPTPVAAVAPDAVVTVPDAGSATVALPKTVIITVDGPPEGTEVVVGGASVGVAPGPVELPIGDHAIVVTFKADGYLPVARAITPDRDQAVAVPMKKKHAAHGPVGKQPGKDDIIDVFGTNKP